MIGQYQIIYQVHHLLQINVDDECQLVEIVREEPTSQEKCVKNVI